jgi:hypothetical protein
MVEPKISDVCIKAELRENFPTSPLSHLWCVRVIRGLVGNAENGELRSNRLCLDDKLRVPVSNRLPKRGIKALGVVKCKIEVLRFDYEPCRDETPLAQMLARVAE